MKTYRIPFARRPNGDAGCLDYNPDENVVYDETEFDVNDGDETELLRLFGDFIAENDFEVTAVGIIEEVPYC